MGIITQKKEEKGITLKGEGKQKSRFKKQPVQKWKVHLYMEVSKLPYL